MSEVDKQILCKTIIKERQGVPGNLLHILMLLGFIHNVFQTGDLLTVVAILLEFFILFYSSQPTCSNVRRKKCMIAWRQRKILLIYPFQSCTWKVNIIKTDKRVTIWNWERRQKHYCAPSCTTASVSLSLFSICCQPSSTIRNRGGVPPLDKLQWFHNTT